jgi:viologen exporter family transport system permease protein
VIADLRDDGPAYLALAGMEIKTFLAFHWSALIYILQSLISMVVFVYFWRALYAETTTIAGLSLATTLAYILLVRIFQPLSNLTMIQEFAHLLRQGDLLQLLVRPLPLQQSYYIQGFASLIVSLGRQLPVLLVALLVFRLPLPTNPAVWAAFLLAALLGRSVLFCLDWLLGCISLYTTSAWGLSFAVSGLAMFLGGGLVPLPMMPTWLQVIAQSTPFAQALAVPIGLLSGLTPLSEAPRLLVIQLLWLAGLAPLSALVFRVAIRRVTIQGG